MKISIITNEKRTSYFGEFLKDFAAAWTDISTTLLINDSFTEIVKLKPTKTSKFLYYFPYDEYLKGELKIKKNNFYIFSSKLFSKNNEILNSDVIICFIDLDNLDENKWFKFLNKLNQFKVNVKNTIFIPWTKKNNSFSQINYVYLSKMLNENMMNDIFRFDNYRETNYINLIIKKIQDL